MQRLTHVSEAYARAGCYLCGRGVDVVDLDVVIVGEGGLCICVRCVGLMMYLVGGIPHEELLYRERIHEERLDVLRARIAALEGTLVTT